MHLNKVIAFPKKKKKTHFSLNLFHMWSTLANLICVRVEKTIKDFKKIINFSNML